MKCDQENEHRRHSSKLRKGFHDIDKSLVAKRDKFIDCTDDSLQNTLREMDNLSGQVQHAPEQAVGLSVFRRVTDIASDRIRLQCRKAGGIDPAEYRRTLMSRFGVTDIDADADFVAPEAFNWKQYGQAAASAVFRTARCCRMDCMLGALEAPKVRAVAKRVARTKDVLKAQARPDEMLAEKQDGSNETSKLTEEMLVRLETGGSAPWVLLVLNPDCFAQTVENMFSVSMLVSNSKAALRSCPEWGLRVEQIKRQKEGGARGVDAASQMKQMIMNFNFGVWGAIRERVDGAACLTPHRDLIELHAGRGAAGPSQPAAKRARRS